MSSGAPPPKERKKSRQPQEENQENMVFQEKELQRRLTNWGNFHEKLVRWRLRRGVTIQAAPLAGADGGGQRERTQDDVRVTAGAWRQGSRQAS